MFIAISLILMIISISIFKLIMLIVSVFLLELKVISDYTPDSPLSSSLYSLLSGLKNKVEGLNKCFYKIYQSFFGFAVCLVSFIIFFSNFLCHQRNIFKEKLKNLTEINQTIWMEISLILAKLLNISDHTFIRTFLMWNIRTKNFECLNTKLFLILWINEKKGISGILFFIYSIFFS